MWDFLVYFVKLPFFNVVFVGCCYRMDDEFKDVFKEAVLKEEETMGFKDREDLVKPQKRAKIDEHSSSESFVCVQQQTQQVEEQSYPATPDFRNTLDAKLASIFPTQFAGYFQNMGHPLKSAAHCVQGTMQSVVDHSKGLLQSREVNGGYRKLSTAQPFSSQVKKSMEFFEGEALIFNKISKGEQVKITLSRNSSGVNPYFLEADPYSIDFLRGECNFVEFFMLEASTKMVWILLIAIAK